MKKPSIPKAIKATYQNDYASKPTGPAAKAPKGYEQSSFDKDKGVKEGSAADMRRDQKGMAAMLAAQGRTKPPQKVQMMVKAAHPKPMAAPAAKSAAKSAAKAAPAMNNGFPMPKGKK